MPDYMIEMWWGCLACNGESKGRHKTCQTCGKPRTETSPEWMPDDMSPMGAIRDQALLEKAHGGEDWKCKFCGSSQFRVDGSCAECGSERGESTGEPKPAPAMEDAQPRRKKWVEKPRSVRPQPVSQPFIDSMRVAGARDSLTDRLEGRSRFNPRVAGFVVATLLLSAVIGLILYFALRVKTVENATVQGFTWTRSIEVERKRLHQHEGWKPDADAETVSDQGERIHHYDTVQVGSHTETRKIKRACGQTCKPTYTTTPRNCKPQKNGFAKCTGGDRVRGSDSCETKWCNDTETVRVPDYAQVARFATWYSWNLWEWSRQRVVLETGTVPAEVTWPSPDRIRLGEDLSPGESERLGGKTERLEVSFGSSDGSYAYHPTSVTEFQQFRLGDRYTLKVQTGSVIGLQKH